MENPLEQAWRASEGVRRAIRERIDFKSYVIPVVVFANMKPSDDIMAALGQSQVKVLWGIDGLGQPAAVPAHQEAAPAHAQRPIHRERGGCADAGVGDSSVPAGISVGR